MHAKTLPPATITRQHEASRQSRETWFYLTIILLSAVVVFAGFSPTFYFARRFGSRTQPVVPTIHGIVMTLWLIYLVIQAILVASKQIALHRFLGWTGAVLGSAAVVSEVWTSFWMVRSGDFRSLPFLKDAEVASAWTLADAFQFAVFFGIGFCFRRRRAIHQRAMLLLVVCTLAPQGFGRLSGVIFHSPIPLFFMYVFVFAGPIYDLVTRRRIHPLYVLGVSLFLLLSPGNKEVIGSTIAWHRFVDWVVRIT